jgi:hypothetical protein
MTVKRVFNVKKTLTGSNIYRPWKDYSEGDVIVGTFQGVHIDNYKKNNAKVKVAYAELADGTGDTLVGKTLVINSCGSLDKALDNMDEGSAYQFVYNGKITLDRGPYAGKEAHSVAIEEVDLEEIENTDAGL